MGLGVRVDTRVGQRYRSEDTTRQDQYIRVLRNHRRPSVRALCVQKQAFDFQLGPCHIMKKMADSLELSGVMVLYLPAQTLVPAYRLSE